MTDNSKNCEISIKLEVLKIEKLVSEKGKKYLKINSKHITNINTGAFVYISALTFNDERITKLERELDIGDNFTAKGEFKISTYKDEKTGNYKNGFSVILI